MAYIAIKVLTSMTLGTDRHREHVHGWCAHRRADACRSLAACRRSSAWLCSFVFATFGLFVGFVFPAENVMQFVGPLLAIMAMFGGLFIPLSQLPKGLQTLALFTPVYGVGQLARAPLVGGATAWAIGSVVFWTLLFSVGAMLLFRRDTTRV